MVVTYSEQEITQPNGKKAIVLAPLTVTREMAEKRGFKEAQKEEDFQQKGYYFQENTKAEELTVDLLASRIVNESTGTVFARTSAERMKQFLLEHYKDLRLGDKHNLAQKLQKLGIEAMDPSTVTHIQSILQEVK